MMAIGEQLTIGDYVVHRDSDASFMKFRPIEVRRIISKVDYEQVVICAAMNNTEAVAVIQSQLRRATPTEILQEVAHQGRLAKCQQSNKT